jgi:hypothetical protein
LPELHPAVTWISTLVTKADFRDIRAAFEAALADPEHAQQAQEAAPPVSCRHSALSAQPIAD